MDRRIIRRTLDGVHKRIAHGRGGLPTVVGVFGEGAFDHFGDLLWNFGRALTQRGVARSVTFVTPRIGEGEDSNDWACAAMSADTAVIYMGLGQAEKIAATLIERGMRGSKPVVVVENASLPGQREFKLTLADLPRLAAIGVVGPAVILIGDVYSGASAQALEPLPRARYA